MFSGEIAFEKALVYRNPTFFPNAILKNKVRNNA